MTIEPVALILCRIVFLLYKSEHSEQSVSIYEMSIISGYLVVFIHVTVEFC